MSKVKLPLQTNNLQGIALMIGGIFSVTIMDTFAKILVEADYSPFQFLAIRGWIITFLFMGWFWYRGQVRHLKTDRAHHYLVRGLIGFCAPFFFFSALREMPLADAVVVSFAAPFIMTALSIPLLGEKVGRYRWAAILIGFIGVVIVIQPGAGTIQSGTIYVLIACLSYSLIQIMTRWMSDTESPVKIVFYFNAVTGIIGTCALPFVWKDMPLNHFLIVIALSAIAMVGHILMTTAVSKAPISVVAPFEYSALVWSTLLGFLIWGDFPAQHVWIGAAIIVLSGIYMIHRERVKKVKPHDVMLDV